jgi:hypothetical protein
MALLVQRAQDAGRLRADLVLDDLSRIMEMLVATLWTMEPGSDGWRRYLGLIFQGLAPAQAQPLFPAVPRSGKPNMGT